jgi:hypothetical protein
MRLLNLSVFIGLFALANLSHASQVAECQGTCVLDDTPVTAKIYSDSGIGKIVIETTIDVVESPTKIDFLGTDLKIYDNNFQMFFTVSPKKSASSVEAFRGGEFFVEDFICVLVN